MPTGRIPCPARWWPDWHDPLTWAVGLLAGYATSLYFAVNAFLPDLLVARGRGDPTERSALRCSTGTQLPASFLMIAYGRRLTMRRWPFLTLGAISLTSIVAMVEMPAGAIVAWRQACARLLQRLPLLVLTLAMPPLMAAPEERCRGSLGSDAADRITWSRSRCRSCRRLRMGCEPRARGGVPLPLFVYGLAGARNRHAHRLPPAARRKSCAGGAQHGASEAGAVGKRATANWCRPPCPASSMNRAAHAFVAARALRHDDDHGGGLDILRQYPRTRMLRPRSRRALRAPWRARPLAAPANCACTWSALAKSVSFACFQSVLARMREVEVPSTAPTRIASRSRAAMLRDPGSIVHGVRGRIDDIGRPGVHVLLALGVLRHEGDVPRVLRGRRGDLARIGVLDELQRHAKLRRGRLAQLHE